MKRTMKGCFFTKLKVTSATKHRGVAVFITAQLHFNKVWTQILRRFKPCSRHVRDLRWREVLTMVPAGEKVQTTFVGHTTKNISSLSSSSSSSSSSSNDNYSTRFIWGTGSTFFISWKGHVPFSRYLSFCIFHHPMIYQICDVMMSIFWIYLLNHNSLSHQTWLIAI